MGAAYETETDTEPEPEPEPEPEAPSPREAGGGSGWGAAYETETEPETKATRGARPMGGRYAAPAASSPAAHTSWWSRADENVANLPSVLGRMFLHHGVR